MEQHKIDRINELARKAKTEEASPRRSWPSGALRREYIDATGRA